MRAGMTLLAGAAIALSACGTKGEADATANADTGLTADKIAANDITAIDAVTGEAANMADDVDYSNMVMNDGNQSGSSPSAKPARPSAKPAAKPAPEPAAAASPAPAQPANSTQ